MSKEVQFERIAEPGRDAIIFNKYFRDRMVDVERVLEETYPKSWNLRPYDITTGQITKKTQNFNGVPKGEEGDRALG